MFTYRKLQLPVAVVPRTETWILLLALACTIFAKFIIVHRQNPPRLFVELLPVLLPDFLFFSAVFLFINTLYLLRPSPGVIRLNLLLVGLIFLWSVLNAVWLIASGVQLQPGIMFVLLRGLVQLWPIAQSYLVNRFWKFLLLVIVAVAVSGAFIRYFCRPGTSVPARLSSVRKVVLSAIAIIILIIAQGLSPKQTKIGFAREVLGFSNHWQALISAVTNARENNDIKLARNIPRTGQRRIITPNCPLQQLPNIVMIFLESIPDSISLSDPNGLMPRFNQIARRSVRFKRTYTVLPYTTKAFWAAFTGTTPTVQEDYVEAIPMDPPYEGLPSILRKVGYRSAFFMMSKGSFECAPGLFANLDFDWAYFRENLEDKSAHLGYMNGDDCRLITPAFEWVLQGNRPFFLAMLTSVSHDPYDVPLWFDKPARAPYEKYLQTVRFNDYFLGQICDKLKELNLEDNTILCILGDHGTSFRVQQGRGRWVPYEEVICVPWVIRWQGHIEPGKCIDQPCSQLDVTPTLLRLIGFDISEAEFEGKDVLGTLPTQRRFYFSSWYPDSPAGFLEGNRKIVYWPYLDKVFEFDLAADPNETKPKVIAPLQAEQIKRDILNWQKNSRIAIDAKRHTEDFLFDHWQTFSAGRSAWAYYIPLQD